MSRVAFKLNREDKYFSTAVSVPGCGGLYGNIGKGMNISIFICFMTEKRFVDQFAKVCQ